MAIKELKYKIIQTQSKFVSNFKILTSFCAVVFLKLKTQYSLRNSAGWAFLINFYLIGNPLFFLDHLWF